MPQSLEPSRLLPKKEHAALLVIDIQQRLLDTMDPEAASNVVRNTAILIQTAQEFGMPVLYSEQYPKGLGPTAAALKELLPAGLAPFEKTVFSCCAAPGFQPLLDSTGDRDLIICGVEAHICVLQTVLDLLSAGRQVYVAADAVCSRSKENWQLGLELMRQAGAVIGSTEIFFFGLFGEARTEPYKRLSKLIK